MNNEAFAVSAAPVVAWLAILSTIIITYLISLQARHIRRFFRTEANRERLGLAPYSHSREQRPFRPLSHFAGKDCFAKAMQEAICLNNEQTLSRNWTSQTARTGNAMKLGNAIILTTRLSLNKGSRSSIAAQPFAYVGVGHA